MAPKQKKQLDKLANLLSGSAEPPPKKKSKTAPKEGEVTPSTATPADTPVETPNSEVEKSEPRKRVRGKGGAEPVPPAKVTKVPKAKAKAKAKADPPPMPQATWENFTLVQEHFGLTEEECTEVLLRVCGPNPKGEEFWKNFKVPKEDEPEAPVEEIPGEQDDGYEEDGEQTPFYQPNDFDSDMSEDDPDLEPASKSHAMAEPPQQKETPAPNEA